MLRVCAAAWLLIACGPGGGGFTGGASPELEVTVDGGTVASQDEVLVSLPVVDSAERIEVTRFLVTNTGSGPLEVRGLDIESSPAGALTLEASPWPTEEAPVVIEAHGAGQALSVSVVYDPTISDAVPSASVRVRTNEDLDGATELAFAVQAIARLPRLDVLPAALDLGNVGPGSEGAGTVSLVSAGSSALTIDAMELQGDAGFEVTLAGQLVASGAGPVTLDPPVTLQAGDIEALAVRFVAGGPDAAAADLIVWTDDPSAPEGTLVPLTANSALPCIAVNPQRVIFGGKRPGHQATVAVEISSCGTAPLEIDDLQLGEDSATSFGIGTLTRLDEVTSLPLSLGVNESITVELMFTPEAVSPLDADAQPIPDRGALLIGTNAWSPETTVDLEGYGVEHECATPVVIVQEGEEVIPQTTLHLLGDQSFGGEAAVQAYEWTVEQPAGSVGVLLPSAAAPNPQFTANVAGLYRFHLRVWDANGIQGCHTATAEVLVRPDQDIHVELLWHTPLDPDETDHGPEAGADLDLHFLHPFATGHDIDGDGQADGWFDLPFDCFFFNKTPDWGSFSPGVDDNPRLDLDDTDGAGPENLNLNTAEDGTAYRVGVHYWRDHGWGASLATVRIYIRGELVWSRSDKELFDDELWDVAKIHWPSGQVEAVEAEDGTDVVFPNATPAAYPH